MTNYPREQIYSQETFGPWLFDSLLWDLLWHSESGGISGGGDCSPGDDQKTKGTRIPMTHPKRTPDDGFSPSWPHLLKFHDLLATVWAGNQDSDL